jgi:cbb3-type cytochrome oxidase subunit 3
MFSASKIFKTFILSGLFLFFVFINISAVLAAGETQKTIDGLKQTATEGYGAEPQSIDFYDRAGSILGIALSFIGIIFLGIMIYAGFMWMLARGNQQEADKAKELIQQAVIGLAIVLSAYVITKFVGEILAPK